MATCSSAATPMLWLKLYRILRIHSRIRDASPKRTSTLFERSCERRRHSRFYIGLVDSKARSLADDAISKLQLAHEGGAGHRMAPVVVDAGPSRCIDQAVDTDPCSSALNRVFSWCGSALTNEHMGPAVWSKQAGRRPTCAPLHKASADLPARVGQAPPGQAFPLGSGSRPVPVG